MKIEDYFKKEVEKELADLAEQLNGQSITQTQFDVKFNEIIERANKRVTLRISFLNLKRQKSSLIFGAIAIFTNLLVILQQLIMHSGVWYVFVLIQMVLITLNIRNLRKYITGYKEAQIELAKRCLI